MKLLSIIISVLASRHILLNTHTHTLSPFHKILFIQDSNILIISTNYSWIAHYSIFGYRHLFFYIYIGFKRKTKKNVHYDT